MVPWPPRLSRARSATWISRCAPAHRVVPPAPCTPGRGGRRPRVRAAPAADPAPRPSCSSPREACDLSRLSSDTRYRYEPPKVADLSGVSSENMRRSRHLRLGGLGRDLAEVDPGPV